MNDDSNTVPTAAELEEGLTPDGVLDADQENTATVTAPEIPIQEEDFEDDDDNMKDEEEEDDDEVDTDDEVDDIEE
ncbi:hypothetical protein DOJK_00092 [Patescibacteria group bacterium]|nr:hypothetical protein [Candidatus Dojkabacteria bacterium]CAG1020102.1 hypothetical protein DOJK_00092 [Patescibacteria group bacterium]